MIKTILEGLGLDMAKKTKKKTNGNGALVDAMKENIASHKKLDELLKQIEKNYKLNHDEGEIVHRHKSV